MRQELDHLDWKHITQAASIAVGGALIAAFTPDWMLRLIFGAICVALGITGIYAVLKDREQI